MRTSNALIVAVSLCFLCLPRSSAAEPLTSSFSYRGYIEEQGSPVSGFLDLEFEVFDALENGASLAQPLTFDIVSVKDGEFTIVLDFGDGPFIGERVWLEVRARPGGTTEPFTTLSPRQELRAVPYATHAQFVGASAISSVEIQDGSIQASDLQAGAVTNSVIAAGAVTPDKLSFSPGDITEVSAGSGLLGGATTGLAELSLDPAVLPPRIQGECLTPTVMTGISSSGELQCELPPLPFERDFPFPLGRDDNGLWVLSGLNKISDCIDPPLCTITEESFSIGTSVCQDLLCTNVNTSLPIEREGQLINVKWAMQAPAPGASGPSIIGVYDYNAIFQLFDSFYCPDAACTTATRVNLGRGTFDRTGLSLITRPDLDGAAIVSFVAETTGDLHLFDCANRTCSGGSDRVVATGASGGTSIALTAAGNPVIMFERARTDDGENAWSYVCADPRCQSGSEVPIDTTTPESIGKIGNPFHNRTDGLLEVLIRRIGASNDIYVCSDTECSSWVRRPDAPDGFYKISPTGETLVLGEGPFGSGPTMYRCADPDCVEPRLNKVETPLDKIWGFELIEDMRPVIFGAPPPGDINGPRVFVCAFPYCR